MRLKTILVALCISLSQLCYGQNLHFEQPQQTLTGVELRDRRKVVFKYHNSTQKPLVIVDSKTFCGCTKVKFNKKPLIKGESDSLVVHFKPTERGAFYKKIVITDSQQGQYTLVIKGVVD